MTCDPDIHLEPVWAERGDFTLPVEVDVGKEGFQRLEHLWCQRTGENCFEVCCIPFFAYNIALGDEVITETDGGLYYITGVARRSGNSTFRCWFTDSSDVATVDTVLQMLASIDCLTERHKSGMLAINADPYTQEQSVNAFLEQLQDQGRLTYEKAHGDTAFDIRVHQDPVWRERANFLISARVERGGSKEVREQLWARQISDAYFEICCIPFFIRNLALGDIVETGLTGDERYVLQKVIKRSHHSTLLVRFSDIADSRTRRNVYNRVIGLGCLVEQHSEQLLAIDTESDAQAELVKVVLKNECQEELVEFILNRQRA